MGQVQLERHGGVAVFTVDSPEVKNGLSPEMGLQLAALCDEVDADPSIGAAVIRGAGGTFCSGADRRRWTAGADQAEDTVYKELGAVYTAFRRIGTLQVPTIAAVRGAAVGAGLNLALSTDLRIVGEDARLLAGFLRIGLHPGGGYFTISSRTAGREATAAMGLFSEEIDGVRAAEIGLALPDAWTAPERPLLRVGAAFGAVLTRLGDIYSPVVNLASRLTSIARPGTFLVDRELAQRIRDLPEYRVRPLRRVSVRGYDHLQPWLVRRRRADDVVDDSGYDEESFDPE